MRSYEPCVCGDPCCPSCGPWYGERCADDEDAERAYQEIMDQEAWLAEQEANSIAAEKWYADNDAQGVDTDCF